jgi:hypothetical protein
MATTQQMREGEAELNRIVQWVTRRTERAGAEAMAAAPPVHPHIAGYCAEARRIAASLAQFPAGTRRRGARHMPIQRALRNAKSRVDSLDGQVRGRIGQYSRHDLDLLLGCTIAPIQAAFRGAGSRAPGSLTAMQNAALQKIQALRAAGAP